MKKRIVTMAIIVLLVVVGLGIVACNEYTKPDPIDPGSPTHPVDPTDPINKAVWDNIADIQADDIMSWTKANGAELTGQDVIDALSEVHSDSSYKLATKDMLRFVGALNADVDLVAVYRSGDGTIIIEGGGDFGISFGNISLMTVITDNKISEIGVGTIDNHRDRPQNTGDITVALVLEYLQGKSLAEIEYDDIDLSTTTDASNSAKGMIESIRAVFDIHGKLDYEILQ